jgi:hypothetical protein
LRHRSTRLNVSGHSRRSCMSAACPFWGQSRRRGNDCRDWINGRINPSGKISHHLKLALSGAWQSGMNRPRRFQSRKAHAHDQDYPDFAGAVVWRRSDLCLVEIAALSHRPRMLLVVEGADEQCRPHGRTAIHRDPRWLHDVSGACRIPGADVPDGQWHPADPSRRQACGNDRTGRLHPLVTAVFRRRQPARSATDRGETMVGFPLDAAA